MKLSEILGKGKPTLSFEVFPPKTADNYSSVETAVEEIAALKPHFMSVTYGAGGGTSAFTTSIAANIQKKHDVTALAHLTCVSSTKEKVREQVELFKAEGIENILALRGDIPKDGKVAQDYKYAAELIYDVKSRGDFCIGGACYPEGHVESKHTADDIKYLKEKVDAGLSFMTTQMFFDNHILYTFLYKIREAGIKIPVVAGIMPVTRANQLERIVGMSGTYLPQRFKAIVDKFGDDPNAMLQAGIAYTTEQIIDLLANGVNHIHIYTMNKPEVAAQIQKSLSEIIK
ncbi:MAG: methylenetetrahydrofolate reductase [Clostridia bacterium]|nr:methylenetetrahydrofolate reductase [NAD(P)H] [Clostridia bacterium]